MHKRRARHVRPEPEQAQIQRHNGTDQECDAENMRKAQRGIAEARDAKILRRPACLDRREQSLHGLVTVGIKDIFPVAEE